MRGVANSSLFRGRRVPGIAVLVGVALFLGFLAAQLFAASHESVTTDKGVYTEGETAIISGSGYTPAEFLDVVVTRADGSIVTGDGTQTPGWDVVQADSAGDFTTTYFFNWPEDEPLIGLYTVEVWQNGVAHNLVNRLANDSFFYDDTGYPTNLKLVPSGLKVTASGTWQWDECATKQALKKHVGFAIDWGDGTGVPKPGSPPGKPTTSTHRDGVYPSDGGVPSSTTGWDNADHCDNQLTGDWGSLSHTYAAAGTFDICVIIYDVHISSTGHPHTTLPTTGNHSIDPWENTDNSFDRNLSTTELCVENVTVGSPTETPTNTPVPPTATFTNTPVPPTATFTNTPVPPTATFTNTPVPPTATLTNTPVVPPTSTNTPPGITPPPLGGSGVFPDVAGSGGSSPIALVTGIAVAVAAGATTLVGTAWYARRRAGR